MDYSTLSTEELLREAERERQRKQQESQSALPDLTHLSDEQLIQLAQSQQLPEQMGPPAPPPEQMGPPIGPRGSYQPSILPSPLDIAQRLPGAIGVDSPAGIGAAVGGTIGSMAPAPFSYPAGIAGAAIGAAGGTELEAARNWAERLRHYQMEQMLGPSAQPVPQPPGFTETMATLPQRALAAAAGQAIGVPAGKVAGALTGLAALPFRDYPQQAAQMNQVASELNPALQLSAGQQTQKPSVVQVEGLTRHTPLSADIPQQFYKTQGQALKQGWQEFVDRIAPGTQKDLETVGRVNAGEGLMGRFGNAQKAAGQLFNRAYAMVGDTKFPISNFEEAKNQIAAESAGIGKLQTPVETMVKSLLPQQPPAGLEAGQQAVAQMPMLPRQAHEQILTQLGLSPQLQKVILDNAPLPGEATLPAMRRIQSGLGEIIRNETRTGGAGITQEGRQAAILAAGIGKDITDVRATDPVLNQLLGDAIDVYKNDVAKVFLNPKSIQTLRQRVGTPGNPIENYTSIVPLFFGSPTKNVAHLNELEKAVGPDNYRVMAAAQMQDILNKSIDRQAPDQAFSPQRFLTLAAPYLENPQFLDKWLGSSANDFRKFVNLTQQTQSGSVPGTNPSRSGQMVVGSLQAWQIVAGIGNLVAGNLGTGAVQIGRAALPEVLARMLFNPKGIRAVVRLMDMNNPVSVQEATRLTAVLTAVAQVPTPWEAAQNGQAAEGQPPVSMRDALERRLRELEQQTGWRRAAGIDEILQQGIGQ